MAATLDGRVEATGAIFEAKFMLPWSALRVDGHLRKSPNKMGNRCRFGTANGKRARADRDRKMAEIRLN
jgi:hypothetical protein